MKKKKLDFIPKLWIMKNGDTILINEMDDKHLNNTLKMLRKKEIEMPNMMRRSFIEAMEIETKKRIYKDLLK